jgi:hypothetical protein
MQINIKKRGEGFQIYADFEFEVLIRKKHKIGNDYFPDWRFSDSWLHVRGDGISYFSGNSYYLENSNQHELGIIPHGIDDDNFIRFIDELNKWKEIQCLNLNINLNSFHEDKWKYLGQLRQVKYLYFGLAEGIVDDDIRFFEPLKQLMELRISKGYQISNMGLKYISGLSNLYHLDLGYPSFCGNPITDDGIFHLQKLRNLKLLDFGSGCQHNISDKGYEHISLLAELRRLSLGRCKLITGKAILHILALKKLTHITLSGGENLTDDDLLNLRTLPQLEYLDLAMCRNITDRGLANLRTLENLKSINLNWCNKITNQGLAHISGLKHLQDIKLSQCKLLTDHGLQFLSKLSSLDSLDLYGCERITKNGIERFNENKSYDLIHI